MKFKIALILILAVFLAVGLFLNNWLSSEKMTVSAEEIYPLFECPCCGQSIVEECCELAKERKAFVDGLTAAGNLSEDEVILIYVKKYGLSSFIDKERQEEFKKKLATEAPADRPIIVLSSDFYDLGDVSQAGGVVSTSFEVKNSGKTDLVINKLETSCGCTSASVVFQGEEGPRFYMPGHGEENPADWKVALGPGQSAQLKVYYDPDVHPDFRGPAVREVSVFSNDPVDFEKMKSLYEKTGQLLTQSQIKILTEGSDEKIKITPENSYFLLNFLWALGITNKNLILEEGPIAQYGEDQIGRFASTGGWTLGTKPSTEFFSKYPIIVLKEEQQKILEEFAFNSYRPCCSNPTGFPDCNHGAAALALGEIMAAQGASVDEIFEAFKYINAFWFPQTYFDVAKYFQAKEGKEWSEVSGRLVAGKDYSTPQGWQRTRQWLVAQNLIEEPPAGGGGCGV